jgi:hypothetical protein
MTGTQQQIFEVELPAGGSLMVQSAEEVDLWETSRLKFVDDYHLSKQNDLVLLGALLQQQLILFRMQRQINGMEPELDNNDIPTGKYKLVQPDSEQVASAIKQLGAASDQIRVIEKALGIDKVTRESGGAHTVENYLRTLKKAAHERAIRISQRVLAYENFVADLRWRVKVLRNADAEDRNYHDLTPEKLIDWAEGQLVTLEEADKKWAREKGKVFVGKL